MENKSVQPKDHNITWAEVAKHNTPENCWIVVNNKVYSVSDYLDDHPGGPVVISNRGGKDVTKPFTDAGHSDDAVKKMEKYNIGSIKEGDVPADGQIDGSGGNNSQIAIVVIGAIIAAIFYFVFLSDNTQQ